jgi:hypothetical protein
MPAAESVLTDRSRRFRLEAAAWQTGTSARRFRFTPELTVLAGRRGVDSDPATTLIERDRET